MKKPARKKRARPPGARNSVRFFEQLESRLAMAAMNGDLGPFVDALPPADQTHSAVVSTANLCFDCTPQTPEYFPWFNAGNPHDVDGDGEVAPGDALAIINYLNTNGPGPVPGPVPVTGPKVAPYLDTTADNQVAPDDVLAVLNKLHYLNLVDKINSFQERVTQEHYAPLDVTDLHPILRLGEKPSEMPGHSDSISYAEFRSLYQSAFKKVYDSQFGSVSREDAERAVDELLSKVVHRSGLGAPLFPELID